jgi:hypothetical protein
VPGIEPGPPDLYPRTLTTEAVNYNIINLIINLCIYGLFNGAVIEPESMERQNMVVSPTGLYTENDCADEGQQTITRPDLT